MQLTWIIKNSNISHLIVPIWVQNYKKPFLLEFHMTLGLTSHVKVNESSRPFPWIYDQPEVLEPPAPVLGPADRPCMLSEPHGVSNQKEKPEAPSESHLEFTRGHHPGDWLHSHPPTSSLSGTLKFLMGNLVSLADWTCQNLTGDQTGPLLHHVCQSKPHQRRMPAHHRIQCLIHIIGRNQPYLLRGPYWVQPNELGQAVIPVLNCAPYKIELTCNDFMGLLANIIDCDLQEGNPEYINMVAADCQTVPTQLEEHIGDSLKGISASMCPQNTDHSRRTSSSNIMKWWAENNSTLGSPSVKNSKSSMHI